MVHLSCDRDALDFSGGDAGSLVVRYGHVWRRRSGERGQRPESDRVGANKVDDHRNCCRDSDHYEHHTDTDGHSGQDGHHTAKDNDRHHPYTDTDEHGRQDTNGHHPHHNVDEPRSGCSSRSRCGRRSKQRSIIGIRRPAGVGMGIDRCCRRRRRGLDHHADSRRSKGQFTERQGARSVSVGGVRRPHIASSMSALQFLAPDA
jgi:hypothetical protein